MDIVQRPSRRSDSRLLTHRRPVFARACELVPGSRELRVAEVRCHCSSALLGTSGGSGSLKKCRWCAPSAVIAHRRRPDATGMRSLRVTRQNTSVVGARGTYGKDDASTLEMSRSSQVARVQETDGFCGAVEQVRIWLGSRCSSRRRMYSELDALAVARAYTSRASHAGARARRDASRGVDVALDGRTYSAGNGRERNGGGGDGV